MQKTKSLLESSTSFFVDFIGIVVVFIVLKELQSIFIPFVIAYFLFFVFTPLHNYFHKIKAPTSLTTVLDILILIFLFGSISSVLVDSFARLGEELPVYAMKLNRLVSETAYSWGVTDPYFANFDINNLLTEVDLPILAGTLFSSTFSFVGTTAFVLFFFIFISSGHQKIYEAIRRRYLPDSPDDNYSIVKQKVKTISQDDDTIKSEETVTIESGHDEEDSLKKTFQEIIDQVQKYIITKFIMSLIMGILVAVILIIAGVDFPVVWAVITFLFHFIPNIGSIIAVLLPSVMALIQFESAGIALVIAAVLIGIQNIVGNILEPKIFGHRLGMNPLVILLSLLLWGYIWGIVGAILSVPLTAIIKIIISRSDSPNMKLLNDIME